MSTGKLLRLLLLASLACAHAASAAILIGSSKKTQLPIVASDWLFHDLGGDTGTSCDAIDANTLDIHAKGMNEHKEGAFCYQVIEAGDSQCIAEIASFVGTTEDKTRAGCMIRDSLDPEAPYILVNWPQIGRVRVQYRETHGGPVNGGSFGASGQTLPQCVGFWWNQGAQEATIYESNDTVCDAGWQKILDVLAPLDIVPPYYVGGFAISDNDANLVTARLNHVSIGTEHTIIPDAPTGPRAGIVYTFDAETGAIQQKSSDHDGGYTKGMAPPLDGTCTAVSTTSGAGDIDGTHYTRVVDSSIQAPMTGNNSLRLMIHKNCDYNAVNNGTMGDIGGPKDKPRTEFHTSGLHGDLPFDEYVWFAHGTFFPADWENDDGAKNWTNVPIWELKIGAGNSAITVKLHPDPPFTMKVWTQFSDTSISLSSPEGNDDKLTLDLEGYLGRWVPWVWRVRMNPFSGVGPHDTSDISGSTGLSYAGDRGSVELWIEDVKKLDIQGPIGAVPAPPGFWTIYEIYKYSWKKASSVLGPVLYFVDDIRVGIESDGAGYADVHPNQTACTDGCP